MAQPATNAKIEELRFKVKVDPKSRLFYPLAEELRKAGQIGEAEQVLRIGLTVHPTYLSAWVSLGRVLREQKKDAEAVEALTRALQLDPGNVVAARLLADAYLSLGEKVEAIKKYKLVHALLPADEDLKNQIDALDRDIRAEAEPAIAAVPELESDETPASPPAAPEASIAAAPETDWTPPEQPPAETAAPLDLGTPAFGDDTAVETPTPTIETPFEDALGAADAEIRTERATGDAEPMYAAHDESPFEEPAADYTSAAMTIEAPSGFHIAAAPLSAEMSSPVYEEEPLPPLDAPPIAPEPPSDEDDIFEPEYPAEPVHAADDVASTITMADLYARQGLVDDARHIYQTILAREPGNSAVGAKLAALERTRAVRRLENWLVKVSRREVGSV